jgi:hypothetical protein
MSNISGNTFFIENSVNCSNLGTINGSVSFLDTSSNCGQVLNATFSGGVNCGQACGCTVFYNSCSFGYVCGTGILRGNSVLYGAADCVIQCDQSIIDAGASVADYEFLVTTGFPTNIYSDDSAYYVYLSGASTIACGFYPTSQTNGGFDLCYFNTGSPICSCDVSENGYPSNGVKYINVVNKYICFWGAANNASYPYYLLCSPNGHTSIGYFDLAEACNSCTFECINLCASAVVLAIPKANYTCSLPIQASDNCLYYIYDAATVTIATGFYSNYAINSGAIDCGYSTNMPAGAIDGGCQIYENGGAICVTGINYILDNSGYYGNLNNLQYINPACAQPIAYKSNLCCFSLVTNDGSLFDIITNGAAQDGIFEFGCCSFSYSALINNYTFCKDDRTEGTPFLIYCISSQYSCRQGKYFLYCNGSGIIPNGLYSNYAFDNSILVNTNYNCALPQITLDNCCYYTYSVGVAAGATGAFSNYYFEPATIIATTCSITTPIAAQDNSCYYLYSAGVAALAAGAYSNYYFEPAGIVATACNITPPISGLDNGLFYNYCAGVPALASGPYSNFAFFEGVICTTFQIVCTALDNSCVYRYTDGVAMYTVCPQGTNVGFISDCYYDIGACFQGGCGDGSITVGGDCCFLIGCNYCCADGADNCGSAYCAFGTYVCYCLYSEGSSSYSICCCGAVNS